MKKKIVVIGASGHAKVIIDIIEKEEKYDIIGLIDSYKEKGKKTFGYAILGTEEIIPELIEKGNLYGGVLAIGDNFIRKELFYKIKEIQPDFKYVNAIHPQSVIGAKVKIGKGVVIMPGVIINTLSKIDDFCILNTKSTLDHECKMRKFSSLGPGTNVGGNVIIDECTAISLGAKVIENIKIGKHSVVGAGALVIRNIGDNKIAFGIPAKEIRTREAGEGYLSGNKPKKKKVSKK